jgi:hypothetical protein
MTGTDPGDLQVRQDIHRAEVLMSLASGLPRDHSAASLKYEAALAGTSLHAAALASLFPGPTEEPVIEPPVRRRRHLFAVPAEDEAVAAAWTGPVLSDG